MHKNLFSVCLALLLCLSAASRAAQDDPHNFLLREGLIFNFLKFINWPTPYSLHDAHQANVCIMGDTALADDLLAKKISSKVHIIKLSANSTTSTCHVLFIGRSEESQIPMILSHTKRRPVLTLSEAKGFADKGGIIEIDTKSANVGLFSQNKTNLRINLKGAEEGQLNIDARLLQIATEVIQ